MFENITHLKVQPDRLAECVAFLRSEIAPLLKRQPGLLNLAIIPRPEHRIVSIVSLWVSAESANRVEYDSLYQHGLQQLDRWLAEPIQFHEKPSRPATERKIKFSNN